MLNQWALKWHVPQAALDDLCSLTTGPVTPGTMGLTEASVQTRVRARATQRGGMLLRNNVGAYKDQFGNFIRYGLANESKKMNKRTKSSDLIGIYPLTVTPQMVGSIVGQFWSVEVKESCWKYRGNEHEAAQLHFIELVLALGGRAQFCSNEDLLV